ncbi:MAG: thioredoxin family protein [Melioribacteraceae bacterium]|nr:thioredoxin family protein [Melioribacteraceae bacterium]
MNSDITTMAELENKIEKSEAVCVYFGSDECGVCKVVRPKVKELLKENFSKIDFVYIDIQEMPGVSSQFSIHTVPVLIIFFESKEFIRKIRNISLVELEKEINRPYGMMF